MSGKNFSTNNVAGRRRKSDFYETPYSLTRLLLTKESFPEPVIEPACGHLAIVKVLKEHGIDVAKSFDIETGMDFLSFNEQYPSIITNPPYSLAFEFVQKAKEVATKKFAFLLPLSYLHGKKRHDGIYTDTDYPLSKVYVFTRYPLLGDPLREDGKHRTGMLVYAWFIWSVDHTGPPTIDWLDNNPCVVRES